MKQVLKEMILFLIGGIIYCLLEICFRGNSHWTMYIVGGLCFLFIGKINEYTLWETPLWIQALIGTCIITLLEFVSGCIINIGLGWNVWDYSNIPLNLLGQICLPFCFIWFGLSIVAIVLDDVLRWKLFKEEKPRYKLF